MIQEKVSNLKGNDAIHSLENGLKMSFLLAMNLSGRKIQTMNEYKGKDADLDDKDRWGDLVIEKDRIHVEYKNIKVEQVVMPDGRWFNPKKVHWDQSVAIAEDILMLNDEDLLNLKLKYPKDEKAKDNRLGRKLQTIRDEWENALAQTKDNQKWISDKIGTSVDSFCVLRVGLYRLKYAKV